jgi:hypothetical protein
VPTSRLYSSAALAATSADSAAIPDVVKGGASPDRAGDRRAGLRPRLGLICGVDGLFADGVRVGGGDGLDARDLGQGGGQVVDWVVAVDLQGDLDRRVVSGRAAGLVCIRPPVPGCAGGQLVDGEIRGR